MLGYAYQIVHEDDSQMQCWVRKMDEARKKRDADDPIPNYMRTRQIIIREIYVGENVYTLIKCGCHYFKRKKAPCRHFYAIMNRGPEAEDFSPECLKSYELYYGEDDVFTKKCDAIIAMIESHGGLLINSSLKDFKMGMKDQYVDRKWYESLYNDIGVDTTLRSDGFAKKLICLPTIAKANDLETLANPMKQSAYTRTKKCFYDCADNATSEEDVMDMINTLNALNGRILGRKKKRGDTVFRSIGSFPATVKAKTVSRKKPPGSPRKRY